MSALVKRCAGPVPRMDSTNKLFISLAPCTDVHAPPPVKRHRHPSPPLPQRRVTSLDALPDECLYEILRRLPGKKDRGIASCVSRRWLMLLCTLRSGQPKPAKAPLPDLNVDPMTEADGEMSRPELSCCLEGKDATDARLAAVAMRDGPAIGRLSLRSGLVACSVTDLGLKAAARWCPSLRAVVLWDVPGVADRGLTEIAVGCPVLEKLDLFQCPAVTDASIVAVAERCPNLTSLCLESCARITGEALREVGRLCVKLQSLSVANCPLVGDEGVCGLVSSRGSTLRKLNLQGLPVCDATLGVVGYYGREIRDLVLVDLPKVAERGFWVMGSTCGLRKLGSFKVAFCDGLTDLGLEAITKGSPLLRWISLRRAAGLSDAGLKSLARSAAALESLHLEECNLITLPGLVTSLSTCCRHKLKSLTVVCCAGIGDDTAGTTGPAVRTCGSVRSLGVRGCHGFGDVGAEAIGKLFPNLRTIDLRSLPRVTDDGVLKLLESIKPGLVKVNLSDCVNLTDGAVSTAARLHGATLESLALEGCRRITDASLVTLSGSCPALGSLDVSSSGVTDAGVAALASTHKASLMVLSLAGCGGVSSKSLAVLGNMGRSLVGLNLQNCALLSCSAVGSLQDKMWWCDVLY